MKNGIGVSPGIGIAQVLVWQPPVNYNFIPRTSTSPTQDVLRFKNALKKVMLENEQRGQTAARCIGDSEAAIFEAYHFILCDDENITRPICTLIENKKHSAEYAVYLHFETLAQSMHELEDDYLSQRAEDFYSLRDLLVREMLGLTPWDASHMDKPTVIVAHSLSPLEIVDIDRSRLEAIVCETGGYSTHAAIIARTMGVPAIMGAAGILHKVQNGSLIAVDGTTGETWVEPRQEEIDILHLRNQELLDKRNSAQKMRGLPTISRDGHRVELSANIALPQEVDTVLDADAEAIGLFRTELLYANRTFPFKEDEQFSIYRSLLEKVKGKGVTVRTLNPPGQNQIIKRDEYSIPFLDTGYGNLKINLAQPGLFHSQLRALLRASAYGDLKIMFPMVTSPREVRQAQNTLENIKQELARKNIPFDEKLPVGAAIEVPAAAFVAGTLAKYADFFSIDINDLAQFTLALDAGNPKLASVEALCHPAVLTLIRRTINAAHSNGIPCVICGELPQQDLVLPLLMGFGADGFSLNPRSVLPARETLNGSSYQVSCQFAQKVLQLEDDQQVLQALQKAQATV